MSSATPVVRRMVMFKHGVAYLERGGPCDGAFELSFKRDEMNDVLKSLSAWVARGEATLGAVAFEKPEDPEEALVRRRLSFSPTETLQSLLASLRGRRIAVEVSGKRHEGEVIGVEQDRGPSEADRKLLVLRTADEALAVIDLATLRGLDLLEAPSRADLAFFVDRSRAATAGESRTITVDVRGRAEDLRVSYIVPAPTWRVTYRFVRSGAETRLMAWAIVHNPADEDLDDIELTLTTGQPVSFVIDLYNPKNVHRTVVEEQSRAGSGPTRFERAPESRRASLPSAMPRMARAPAPAMMAFSAGPPEEDSDLETTRSIASMGDAMEDAATFDDRGELFEYRVAARVSLKRGGSAMVPLFSSQLEAKRERLWRDGSGPNPDLVLSFANDTGAVLEEGAAVVYDESVYAGEAMVPYSARGVAVKLAFAKDLGVRCKREAQPRSVLAKVRLTGKAFVEEMRHELHHTLTAESDHSEAVDVVVELPKAHGRSFDPDHAQPFEDTSSFHRFRIEAPPRGRATLKVVERWFESRRTSYDTLDLRRLNAWLEDQFLDRAAFDRLSGVLGALEEARQNDALRAEAERGKQAAWAKQGKLAEQLKVLRDTGPEGELRLRYVKELEAEQTRVNALEAEDARLAKAADDARARARELLKKIGG
jgi:hypothetical protein